MDDDPVLVDGIVRAEVGGQLGAAEKHQGLAGFRERRQLLGDVPGDDGGVPAEVRPARVLETTTFGASRQTGAKARSCGSCEYCSAFGQKPDIRSQTLRP
ncbi:hypothetical protein R1T08_23820 [Streptomyces sp. SBC-4]|nr:hypothetical protein [Streptomyces sp. SBC-4]MDV5147127.1 hypothetical protein [Streptomyces sp. SBC-4]